MAPRDNGRTHPTTPRTYSCPESVSSSANGIPRWFWLAPVALSAAPRGWTNPVSSRYTIASPDLHRACTSLALYSLYTGAPSPSPCRVNQAQGHPCGGPKAPYVVAVAVSPPLGPWAALAFSESHIPIPLSSVYFRLRRSRCVFGRHRVAFSD